MCRQSGALAFLLSGASVCRRLEGVQFIILPVFCFWIEHQQLSIIVVGRSVVSPGVPSLLRCCWDDCCSRSLMYLLCGYASLAGPLGSGGHGLRLNQGCPEHGLSQ